MNAKLAKKIRRKARNVTIGAPAVAYLRERSGVIKVDPKSTKGVYKMVKKHVAKERRA